MSWVVLPVKSFERAKSRLGPTLSPERRRALARSMFLHVGRTVEPLVDGVLVATDGDDVAMLAAGLGFDVLRDDGPARLARIVDRALGSLAGRVDTALVLMSDLPELSRHDVRAVLAEPCIAPDRHDLGTNALHVPIGASTSFGHADSFLRHRALGLPVVRRPGLAQDVDSPSDLFGLARASV